MHEKEMETSPPRHRRKGSMFCSRSRSPSSRSLSPRAGELNELLHVRTMHSFTRRMKSFNKDRNPDLLSPPPQHMRQTCSSLIKRHGYGMTPALAFLSPTGNSSRRTTSVGAALAFDPNSETASKKMQSTVRHARGYSADCTPNDHLGFLMEEMKQGFRWADSHGIHPDSYGLKIKPSSNQGHKTRRQSPDAQPPKSQPSTKAKARKARGKSTRPVETHRSRPKSTNENLVNRPASAQATVDVTRRYRQRSVISDPRSDTANNTTSGAFDEERLSKEASHRKKNATRPKSAVPMKEVDEAGVRNSRKTSATTKSTSSRNNGNGNNPNQKRVVTQRSRGLQSGNTRKPKNHVDNRRPKTSVQGEDVKPKPTKNIKPNTKPKEENEIQGMNEMKHDLTTTQFSTEGEDQIMKAEQEVAKIEEQSFGIEERPVEIAEEPVNSQMKDELEFEATLNDRQLNACMTMYGASVLAPTGMDTDPPTPAYTPHHSDVDFCDARSNSYRSSARNGSSDYEQNENTSEITSIKMQESLVTNEKPEDSTVPTEKVKRRKQKRSKKSNPRLSLLARMKCCRISLRSCICGAPVSPRAEIVELDRSTSVTLYD